MSGAEPQVGDRLGRYKLVEVLGRGGMGTVFRARDEALERDVAVKVIHPQLAVEGEFRERFRREAVLLSAMDSPHVVAVHDHGEQDGAPYLVTQLVRGGDLLALVRAQGALAPARAVDLVGQVLDGLSDAHAAGVVHRDVKPSNVLLREDGRVAYLCDFGIATSPGSEITRTGALVGSTAYMAPERHDGETAASAGVSSDVYAAGCLLWQLLTGSQPYVGTEGEIAMGHLRGPIPQLPGGTPFVDGLNAVLRRAMAKDPAQRYPSAKAMARELAALEPLVPGGLVLPDVTAIRQPVIAAPEPASAARSPWRRVLVTAAVVALVASGVYVGSRLGGVPVGPSVLASDSGDASASPTSESPAPSSSSSAAGPSSAASSAAPGREVSGGAGGSSSTVEGGDAVPPGVADGGDPAPAPAPAGSAGDGAAGTGRTSTGTRPSASSRPTRAASPAPTRAAPAPAPTPKYRCWNGTRAVKLSSCPLPTGRAGAEWVFPGFAKVSGCTRATRASSAFVEGWTCRTKNPNGTYRYLSVSRWTSPSPACDHFWSSYDKGTRFRGDWTLGGKVAGRRMNGTQNKGKIVHSSRVYIGNGTNAWAVSAWGTSDAQRDAMLGKVGFRKPADFRGVPL
ncbi:serine/threonine-protein kinase [Nocardioides sp.]|uniref:serine/threonine-protein kinase n=1 Tax=Nocardioides sp. TaxID=35761 RepID=UPI003517376C